MARRLPSTYPTLCCKENWVISKIRVLENPEAWSKKLDLENFIAVAGRAECRQYIDTDDDGMFYCTFAELLYKPIAVLQAQQTKNASDLYTDRWP